MEGQQKQTILDLPKVIAIGIASPVATFLTSRFGVAGTLIGLALSAMVLTVLVDLLKVYLAHAPATVAKVPETVAKMPGGLRTDLSWPAILGKLSTVFARSSFLTSAPPTRRRAIFVGSLVAAGISFLVGLGIVTALELGLVKAYPVGCGRTVLLQSLRLKMVEYQQALRCRLSSAVAEACLLVLRWFSLRLSSANTSCTSAATTF